MEGDSCWDRVKINPFLYRFNYCPGINNYGLNTFFCRRNIQKMDIKTLWCKKNGTRSREIFKICKSLRPLGIGFSYRGVAGAHNFYVVGIAILFKPEKVCAYFKYRNINLVNPFSLDF